MGDIIMDEHRNNYQKQNLDELPPNEQLIHAISNVYRQNIRAFNADKSDEELGIDQPLPMERNYYFWKGEFIRFKNFVNKLLKKFQY